jgi:hypothetical protein
VYLVTYRDTPFFLFPPALESRQSTVLATISLSTVNLVVAGLVTPKHLAAEPEIDGKGPLRGRGDRTAVAV